MNSQKGFTLIELLVVVLIIGILSAVALPQYHQAVWKARFAKIYPIMADIERQVEMYRLEEGSYPTNCVDIALTLPNGAVMNEEGSYCNFKVGDDLYFTVGPERAWAQLYQGNPDGGLFVEYDYIYPHTTSEQAGWRLCGAGVSHSPKSDSLCKSLGGTKLGDPQYGLTFYRLP